jgi:glycine betaine/proline transport system ATP-binding protein
MSEAKIQIKNLYKIFGKNPKGAMEHIKNGVGKDELLEKHNHVLGLKDINLDIHAQSVQVVMGLSGSGKSTLIRHINRLIEPTDGSVTVDGDEVLKMNEEELRSFRRSKTAMVFQRFALLPHKTVLQNTIFGLHIQNISEEDANKSALRWIERVGLSGYEDKYPQHLSGGMQQRVGLARALTNDGDILLMDEAFSALDPLIRKDMQDILLELHKTVVFITHDLDEALKIGDRIAILKDGIMDQEGIPAEILLNPKTKYVKDFVEDVNRARVIKAKHIMSEINGQDLSGAMPIDQDDFIDRFIDKVISDKPDNLIIQDKDKKNVGFLSTKKLSEILKR